MSGSEWIRKYRVGVMTSITKISSGMGFSIVLLTTAFGAGAEENTEMEQVVVTGSRIKQDANLVSSAPVTTVSGDSIRGSGKLSLVDVLNDTPALLSSTSSENSIDSDQSDIVDGSNVLDLRGLGIARTLVLVNGRRHIGGVQGSASVDVGSISPMLIDRVEVLTGGASAIYGADPVTGVVNFIMKEHFEGFEIDARQGISHESDGEQTAINALWGTNFADNRGNVMVSVGWEEDQGLRVSERKNGALLGSGRDWLNPAKSFQKGDIDAASMPNFAQFYSFAGTGRLDYGFSVPSEASFATDYQGAFGGAPTLTSAEKAFIAQAEAAPERAVKLGRTFPFTSGYGYIAPGNAFTFDGFDAETAVDLDANGVPDCLDSFTGFNSSLTGTGAFGALGGCWNVNEDGSIRPIQDGLIASGFQGFGGDSFNTIQQRDGYILTPEDKVALDLIASFELTDTAEIFVEAKYVKQTVDNESQPTSFWDLLLGAPDNPFLPASLQAVAQTTNGLSITIDPIGIGQGKSTVERETTRFVVGLKGVMFNDWDYEVSVNYGEVDRSNTRHDELINDRFLAAIDAVTDPATGQPACRAEVDPTAPATTTPFDIPTYDPGYYSFTPGAGQCVPLNIWAGSTGITPEALAFVTTTEKDSLVLDQLVVSAFITGDLSEWFELPAGPIAFATGIEYRDEESRATFDNWQLGIIPAGSPFPAGSNISDHSNNSKLTFRPNLSTRNEVAGYDVTDVFAEARVPIIEGLDLDVAARFSDYSTIGEATSWKGSLTYSPVDDLALRVSISETVRAPNITELFGPAIGTTFRPNDPCDAAQIAAIRNNDAAAADATQANCVTALEGIGVTVFDGAGAYIFADPLSASFGGVTGGNRNLNEETADTLTYGLVYQPRFIENFTISIDRWEIDIDDAINSVSGQNIADGCYASGAGLNESFCGLLTRNPNAGPQHGGFTFIQSTSINFARQEAAGIDLAASYGFLFGDHDFKLSVQGTKVSKLDDYTNPTQPSFKDPELGEYGRPELAGSINLAWHFSGISVNWQSQFQDEQVLKFVEIETAKTLYGDAVFQDSFWIHGVNANYDWRDDLNVYGGINNIADKEQFITNFAFPTSPRGRYFFLGIRYRMQ